MESSSSGNLRRKRTSTKGGVGRGILGWLFIFFKTFLAMLHDVFAFWLKKVLFGGPRKKQLVKLQEQMEQADSFEEWKKCALEIDRLEGKEEWKQNAGSSDYDYTLIDKRLKQLRHMRESEDVWSLIFLLRAGLSRNLGGIGNPKLFLHTKIGTKKTN